MGDDNDRGTGQHAAAGAAAAGGRTVGAFARAIARRFAEERCVGMASSLSFTSLLAIVPLAAVGFAVLAAVPLFTDAREDLEALLFANLVPESAEAVRGYFDKFVANTAALSSFGAVGLVVTAVLLLETIETSLNHIFRVASPRPLAKRLAAFVVLIVVGPVLAGASFSAAAYLFAVTNWLGVDPFTGPLAGLAKLMPTLIMVVLLIVFYVVTPNRRVDIGAAAVGATVAGILFYGLRALFGLYVTSFPVYQTIYGALSVIPIFLVWMYMSWIVVLGGAVLTAVLAEWQEAPDRKRSG